jgi:lysine 2,3-aminomutase
VHQQHEYDRVRGISRWTKNYRTSIEVGDPDALTRTYPYYDPIDTLPQEGQAWWRENADTERLHAKALEQAASSRAAAQAQAQAAAPTHTL